MAINSSEWTNDGFSSCQGGRGNIEEGNDKNVVVAFQGQVTAKNKLLQSMALSQVDATSSSFQAVKQMDEMGCVGCDDPHNTKTATYVKHDPYSNTYNPG